MIATHSRRQARPTTSGFGDTARVLDVVRRYWGYTSLRPLQQQAIAAGVENRDSLVVLPTGGGKSLCYQVPPVLADRTDVVIPPLISLMKDQVDGLRACGYPAAAMNSGMTQLERRQTLDAMHAGKLRLLFVAPERLMAEGFLSGLERWNVRSFAIDEAHCISHWGHDFRPEYRKLAELKKRFPQASIHAYTATATERVRRDIAQQLGLVDPAMLVGTFDRPNLTYRVVDRVDGNPQVLEAIRRHAGEAVIVYCISRKDTEALASFLQASEVRAAFYHAGMNPDERRRTQDEFSKERLDVIVATVAFGMGIDRSNVRCVIHAAMPKSVEHYQQETGRAGRDGLEAECLLLYSFADFARWKSLLTRSAEEAQLPPQVLSAQLELLEHLRRYCQPFGCRHRFLSEYFGQAYDKADCKACDVCLNESPDMEDATVAAQKILSCVARTEERFGVKHIADVLRGGDTEMIRKWNHQRLSTYGLMKDTPKKLLLHMINQLCDQSLLDRTADTYRTLKLNDASWQIMRGRLKVSMFKPPERPVREAGSDSKSWGGVHEDLFNALRALRRQIADERSVPAFAIMHDTTLRDLARRRPRSEAQLRGIPGLGEQKLQDFGRRILDCIHVHTIRNPPTSAPKHSASLLKAFQMFDAGASVESVMSTVGRARSTTHGYLARYVEERQPKSIRPWVDDATYARIETATKAVNGDGRLKPIFEHLGGEAPYEQIRMVVTHLTYSQ